MRLAVLPSVALVCVQFAIALPATAADTIPSDRLRASAGRALALLVETSASWPSKKTCTSCHHQFLPALAFDAARRHGVPFDQRRAAEGIARGYAVAADLDRAVQATRQVDPPMDSGTMLTAAAALGVPSNGTLTTFARLILTRQKPDGSWNTIDGRPPQSYSLVGAAAYAAHAVDVYAGGGSAEWGARAAATVTKARGWLEHAPVHDTADRVFQVAGLLWTRADRKAIAAAAGALMSEQRNDGGWAQHSRLGSDAYATGSVIVALGQAGVPADDPAIVRGLRFLLDSQEPDGSWHVRSRIGEQELVSPPHVESGFPHGPDQMISAMATAQAVMALSLALPVTDAAPGPFVPASSWTAAGDPEWVRVAQSGTVGDLARALDQGLSPNAATAAGTSILMVVAPDLGKIRLLLDRGADPNRAADSGITPLMVAANYTGATEAVRLLIARGAAATTARPAVNDATASAYAIWSGDTATLEAVLAAGGTLPGHVAIVGGLSYLSALDLAVLQRDEPMVRALVAHGVDVAALDEGGLPALAQAVLMNDAGMVRLLLALGANVNQVDQTGQTPLMHAAQTDFGDTAVLEALLTAGATRDAVDKNGRTALDLARRSGLTALAAVIEAPRTASTRGGD